MDVIERIVDLLADLTNFYIRMALVGVVWLAVVKLAIILFFVGRG